MARSIRSHRRFSSRHLRPTPYPVPSYRCRISRKEELPKKSSLAIEKKDWKDATCSVCMESPHNAVLLLCSSHDKGCRPYMCGTSYRYSNCLDQFQKAYSKMTPSHSDSVLGSLSHGWPAWKKSETMELTCPLCRGQVKGWTVVEPAREYLNKKMRSCMQDDCSFVGTYKELRKHMRAQHPLAKPRAVDPVLEQKWRALEHQREREDVISTIRSSMPRAVVLGDYVIEMDDSESDFSNDDDDGFDDEDEEFHVFERENNRNSRNILYILLREAARLRGLNENNDRYEGREEGNGHVSAMAAAAANAATAAANAGADAAANAAAGYPSEEYVDIENALSMMRSERQRQREPQQRQRRRGRSAHFMS